MKPQFFMRYFLRIAFTLVFLSSVATGFAGFAHAEGTFIPAPDRVDMVHDPIRNLLYITSGSEVLRYNLKSQQFLPPIQLGGNLKGVDLSPDANTLAVADYSYAGGQNWIYLIDLSTGSSRKITSTLFFYEGGTYSVAYGNDGNILFTSAFNGSGWVPLRKHNPVTGATTLITSNIRQDTMLGASADGSTIGFAESNVSDGRWGRYRVIDGNFVERTGAADGTGWFNYEIGVNRDGTQFAIPTYGGTFVYDAAFAKIATLGQNAGPQPIGVVYHPTKNIVYFAWAETTEVRAYDTTDFTQVGSYNFEYTFLHSGNRAFTQGRLKISRDGSLLFATVEGGVRYVQLNGGIPPVAHDQTVQTKEDTPVSITLQADSPSGGTLSYHVLTLPLHGTLSGDPPNVTYVPAAGYYGSDSFSFNANNGSQDSNAATVTIDIAPVNQAPVAMDDTAYTRFGMPVLIPVLANDKDVDGDKMTVTAGSRSKYGYIKVLPHGRLLYLPWHVPSLRCKSLVDVFNYSVSDGHGGTATAKVTVNIVWKR